MFFTNSCFYEKKNSSVIVQGGVKENVEMFLFLVFPPSFLIQGLGKWDVHVCFKWHSSESYLMSVRKQALKIVTDWI